VVVMHGRDISRGGRLEGTRGSASSPLVPFLKLRGLQ
jgi:hypothetical protein